MAAPCVLWTGASLHAAQALKKLQGLILGTAIPCIMWLPRLTAASLDAHIMFEGHRLVLGSPAHPQRLDNLFLLRVLCLGYAASNPFGPSPRPGCLKESQGSQSTGQIFGDKPKQLWVGTK